MTIPPAQWELPDPHQAEPGEDLIAIGGGLDSGTLIAAYSRGLFPMDVDVPEEMGEGHVLGWWSPDPRGVIEPGEVKVSRSLARSIRRFDVTFDHDFRAVVVGCADPSRPRGWITEEFIEAYWDLHDHGIAHSIEVWSAGDLVGGLYGVEVGGLFAGESMFHRQRDASKVALVALAQRLVDCGSARLIDVQWQTDHLASLGAVEIPRQAYLDRLPELIRLEPCLGDRRG